MAIDRRLLIFGNAVLFSTLGCEVGGSGGSTPDAERQTRDGRVEADLDPAADMAPEADMQPEIDMAPAPDLAVADMALDPDASLPVDMAPVEADMSFDPDMAPEVDMAWLPDMAPPDPDMAIVPDMAPLEPDMAPPLGCADLIGDACQVADEGCCPDGMNPEAVCWGDANGRLTWQSIPGDFFCNCFLGPDQTNYTVACAVPGFVGVERAGRRLRGPRLRALLAA